MFSVSDNGPFERQGDQRNTGVIASLMYQPLAMRFRGIAVLTNTPPRGPQSQPGGMQAIVLMEPVIAKAARKLGIDQVAIRRINAPAGKAMFGPPSGPKATRSTSPARSSRRRWTRAPRCSGGTSARRRAASANGSKVRGVGVAVSTYSAGSVGFDGLFVIKPDGRLYIQSGIGNHGTGSVSDCHRVSAESARRAVGEGRGHLGRHGEESAVDVPQRRQPDDSRHDARGACRRRWTRRRSCRRSRRRISAAGPRTTRWPTSACSARAAVAGMSLAKAAQRAIELGGVYDGHELPKDINRFTKTSATALAGQGLMGVRRTTTRATASSRSFVAGFAEVEVDVETGKYLHPGLSGRRPTSAR